MGKKLQRRTTAGLGVAAGAGAALLFSLGNAPLAGAAPDDTLNDLLNASTNQFTAFSNNITDNLQASTAGDNAIFGDYIGGLANSDVNNAAALNGLDEVSGQLNTQLANTNSNDLAGFQDVLGADNDVFGNVGGGTESATPTADQIATVLSNNGLTDADFTNFNGGGGTLNDAAAALAANPHTDVFGDDVIAGVFNGTGHGNGTGVFSALQDAGIFAGGQPNQPDVFDTLIANDLNGATPLTGGEGTTVPSEPALGDVLGAQTDQFTAYSNNLTDNLLAAGNGDAGIYSDYLNGLANPDIDNGAAFNGLQEVSGQLNDQLANSNSIDLGGFDSVLDQDFTNLGDFLNPGDFLG